MLVAYQLKHQAIPLVSMGFTDSDHSSMFLENYDFSERCMVGKLQNGLKSRVCIYTRYFWTFKLRAFGAYYIQSKYFCNLNLLQPYIIFKFLQVATLH